MISSVVIEELERIPEESRRKESLALVNALEKLDYTAEVAEIAVIYLQHKLMPVEAIGDADHLALASFYNCDMLVTARQCVVGSAHAVFGDAARIAGERL